MEPEGYRAIVPSQGRKGRYHLRVLRQLADLRVEAALDTSEVRRTDAQHIYLSIPTFDGVPCVTAEVETDRLCPASVEHVPVGTIVNRSTPIIQKRT